jgi:uncharacterized protein (DUF488 family)
MKGAARGDKVVTRSDLEVFTIGHSTHSYEHFLALLRCASINAVADVRTSPYSRNFPHFNRESIRDEFRRDNIAYVFLGNELGGRPNLKSLFRNGVADYERMAETTAFQLGLVRIIEGAKKYRIAMMCSEHHPLDCHRCLLVGRALYERGVKVRHILSDRKIIDQEQIEHELIKQAGRTEKDFFESDESRRAVAYKLQAEKVAYSKPTQTDSAAR